MGINVNVKGINVAVLSDEQKQQLASILGISVEDIKITEKKVKEVNNLQMKEESETIAVDPYSGEEFDITLLSEEELAQAKKTGLSPASYKVYEEGQKIKELMKGKTSVRGPRNAVSAASRVVAIIESNQSKITPEIMNVLMDKEESKKLFRLAYPLFIEIPSGASEENKKEMRKVKGMNRFGKQEWKFDQLSDRMFFMTNDIYNRNVDLLEKFFTELPAIKAVDAVETTDAVEAHPATKKVRKSKKNS